MNNTKSYALQVNRDAIVSDLVVDNIIDKLISKFVIDEEDKGQIDKENNERDKARCLLDILVVKDDETYEKFKEILEPDYSWLAKLLEFDSSSELIQRFQQDALTLGGVPREPPHYVERKDILRNIRKELLILERSNFLMLHGMPGSGKSCLARSAICDHDILNKMSNRVYWCSVGECTTDEQIEQHLNRLYVKVQSDISFRGNRPASSIISEKMNHLHDILRAQFTQNDFRNTLLVLDDVRDSRTLDIFDLGCKVLLTSKNKEVLSKINSKESKIISVKDFTEAESVQLFSNCMSIKVETLTPPQLGHLKTIHNLCRGLPMVVALIGGQLKLAHGAVENQVERMEDCIERLTKHDFSSDKIFSAIDICIRDLSEELREKFQNMAIFLEDVNIPSSVLQLLWGKSKYCVEDIMAELQNRSLVLGQFNVENREFVYGLHDLLLAYLKHRLNKHDIQNMHMKLIETYRQKCNGDFSKLPNDNYIYSYLGYHFEEANQPLPDIYLDLNFIGAKIRATSPADLLGDFRRFEDKIVKNDPLRKSQLKEMEEFVEDCRYNLYRYPDLCVVQLALMWRPTGLLKALAQNIIKNNPNRVFLDVWCKEKGPPHAQILELTSVPSVARFSVDTNQIIVGYGDGNIQMWNLNYFRACANFKEHKNSVNVLEVSPTGENFISLSNGAAYLWNIPASLSHSSSALNGTSTSSPSPIVRQRPWSSLHDTDISKFSASHNFEFDNDRAFKYACYSDNGELLCLSSDNGYINIHNVFSGKTEYELTTELENITSCCFYKKDYIMLAADNYIWLYDLKNEIIGKFEFAENIISLLNNRLGDIILITPTSIGYFQSPQPVRALQTDIHCTCAAITPDGDIVVIGGQDGLTVFEIKYDIDGVFETIEIMHHIPDLTGVVTFVDIYQNGPSVYVLVSSNKEPQIKIWSLQPGDFTTDYNKTSRRLPIFDCIFDPLPGTPEAKDPVKSLTNQMSNNHIGKLDSPKIGNILNSPRHNVNYQVAVADNSHKVQIMRGHSVINSDNYKNGITCIAISSCGVVVAYALDDGFVYIYETKARLSKKVLKLPARVCYLEFFDNFTLVAADYSGTLMVWTHSCSVRLYGHDKLSPEIKTEQVNGFTNGDSTPTDKVIRCFAFESCMISISENCSMKLWDYEDRDSHLISVLWGKLLVKSKVTCAALRNMKFAVGQDDGTFMILQLEYMSSGNMTQLKALCKHVNKVERAVQCLDLSPDGSIMALGLKNGDITLWSTKTNSVLTNLKLHKSGVRHLLFAPQYCDRSPLVLLSTSDVLAWWNISYCMKKYKKTKTEKYNKVSKTAQSAAYLLPELDLTNIAQPDLLWVDKIGPTWRPELMLCMKLEGKFAFKVVANNSFSAFVTVDESGQFYLMRLK